HRLRPGVAMAAHRVVLYQSPAELCEAAARWDDLWRRSDGVLPNARANFIADFVEQFSPGLRFVAMVVEADGQPVAALPLVEQILKRFVNAGALPANSWCWAGDLMVDLSADVPQALSTLVAELRRLPGAMLGFG